MLQIDFGLTAVQAIQICASQHHDSVMTKRDSLLMPAMYSCQVDAPLFIGPIWNGGRSVKCGRPSRN